MRRERPQTPGALPRLGRGTVCDFAPEIFGCRTGQQQPSLSRRRRVLEPRDPRRGGLRLERSDSRQEVADALHDLSLHRYRRPQHPRTTARNWWGTPLDRGTGGHTRSRRSRAQPGCGRSEFGRMDGATVKHLVEAELAGAEPFANLHGITSENIREFLVEPVPVTVLWHGMEPGGARCGSCCRSARQTATSSPSTHRRGCGDS